MNYNYTIREFERLISTPGKVIMEKDHGNFDEYKLHQNLKYFIL